MDVVGRHPRHNGMRCICFRMIPPSVIITSAEWEYAGRGRVGMLTMLLFCGRDGFLDEFVDYELQRDAELHILPSDRHKTVVIRAYIHRDLDERTTAAALLPFVLQRGCRRWPATEGLRTHLDNLYGVSISADVFKLGRRHLLVFDMELPDPSRIPEEPNLLAKSLETLGEVLFNPLIREGGLDSNYVAQEKVVMRERIVSIQNDKVRYALQRCIEEMCRDEAFSIHRYGDLGRLEHLEGSILLEVYGQLLPQSRVDVYLVGNVQPDWAAEEVKAALKLPDRRGSSPGLPDPGPFYRHPDSVHTVEERMEVNQGKLCLGYRTNIGMRDPLKYALVYYNGVLGGFTHSKLFQNVREKASLAYYASSGLERTYGIQYIHSGIEIANYSKALDIILKQVDALKQGDVGENEFEFTRQALIRQWKASRDSQREIIEQHLLATVNAIPFVREDYLAGLESVRPADLGAVAERVELDTIYFLRGSEEAIRA